MVKAKAVSKSHLSCSSQGVFNRYSSGGKSDRLGRPWENIMFKRIKQLAKKHRRPKRRAQPPPEEDLGGGDICSLQEQPSTDDDQPLD
jgi:hypothetical protein